MKLDDAGYEVALAMIEWLMEKDVDLGTPEGDVLEVLVTLAEAYESILVPELDDAILRLEELRALHGGDGIPSRARRSSLISPGARSTHDNW